MNVLAIICQKRHCRLTAVIFMAILPTVAGPSFGGEDLSRKWRWGKGHGKEEEISYEGAFACWANKVSLTESRRANGRPVNY